jgi:hypothetical protein
MSLTLEFKPASLVVVTATYRAEDDALNDMIEVVKRLVPESSEG